MLPDLSMITQPKKGGFQMPTLQHKPVVQKNTVTPNSKVYGGSKDKQSRPAKAAKASKASKGTPSKGTSKKAKAPQDTEKKKSTKASFPNAPKGAQRSR